MAPTRLDLPLVQILAEIGAARADLAHRLAHVLLGDRSDTGVALGVAALRRFHGRVDLRE
jgi:hypothetical protein